MYSEDLSATAFRPDGRFVFVNLDSTKIFNADGLVKLKPKFVCIGVDEIRQGVSSPFGHDRLITVIVNLEGLRESHETMVLNWIRTVTRPWRIYNHRNYPSSQECVRRLLGIKLPNGKILSEEMPTLLTLHEQPNRRGRPRIAMAIAKSSGPKKETEGKQPPDVSSKEVPIPESMKVPKPTELSGMVLKRITPKQWAQTKETKFSYHALSIYKGLLDEGWDVSKKEVKRIYIRIRDLWEGPES